MIKYKINNKKKGFWSTSNIASGFKQRYILFEETTYDYNLQGHKQFWQIYEKLRKTWQKLAKQNIEKIGN